MKSSSWNVVPHLLTMYHMYVEGVLCILVVLVRLSLRLMLLLETRFSCVQCLLKSISCGEIFLSGLLWKHSFSARKAHENFRNIHTSVFPILATIWLYQQKTGLEVTGAACKVASVWRAVCGAVRTALFLPTFHMVNLLQGDTRFIFYTVTSQFLIRNISGTSWW